MLIRNADLDVVMHITVGGARLKYEEALALDPLHVDTYNAWALLCKSKSIHGTTNYIYAFQVIYACMCV
jgi:hypothetical protein